MSRQAFESWRFVAEMTQPTRRRSVRSVAQIAADLQVSPSLVFQWGEPDGRKLHVDMVPALVEATEDTLLVEKLNEACGLVAVAAPGGAVDGAALGQTLREFGEFVGAVAAAVEDGVISGAELKRIEREGWEVLHCVVGLMENARANFERRRLSDGRRKTLAEVS